MTRLPLLCLLAFSLLGSMSWVTAASAEDRAPVAFDERDKALADGRSVVVAVPQSEIATEVDVGRVISDAAYGGGLLGGLINTSRDHKREDLVKIDTAKAEADIAPLRQSLADIDFAAKVTEATRSGFAQVDWFHAVIAGADAAPQETGQSATVTWRYRMSPDFTQIRILTDLVVTRAEAAHAAKTAPPKPPTTLFAQRILVIAQLQKRSYDHAQNVAQWNADHGRLARASIETALAHVERLMPYVLNMTPAAITALQKSPGKVFAAGFYGPPVPAFAPAPDETTLWKQGVIDVIDVASPDAVAVR
jgi:hypothetical protein